MLHATVSVRYDDNHVIPVQWEGCGNLLVQEILGRDYDFYKSKYLSLPQYYYSNT